MIKNKEYFILKKCFIDEYFEINPYKWNDPYSKILYILNNKGFLRSQKIKSSRVFFRLTKKGSNYLILTYKEKIKNHMHKMLNKTGFKIKKYFSCQQNQPYNVFILKSLLKSYQDILEKIKILN